MEVDRETGDRDAKGKGWRATMPRPQEVCAVQLGRQSATQDTVTNISMQEKKVPFQKLPLFLPVSELHPVLVLSDRTNTR